MKVHSNFSRVRGSSGSRTRGQALLFAVLLMVFAALLGATFVTVVSLNLNQTDRSVARTDAVTAAQAGLKFANDQIVSDSTDGEAWRPEKIAPPPDIDDSSYNEYYTPFERAQGWAMPAGFSYGSTTDPEGRWALLKAYKTSNPGARFFVKFPDPRGKETSGPVSLIEVSTETASDKAGYLRLTIIGRSEDNDAAFARLVVDKPTAQAGGPLAFARFDGNYDMSDGKPLAARGTLESDSKTITISSALKYAPGVTVAVISGTNMQIGVVAAISSSAIVLKTAVTGPLVPGPIEVRAASVLADGLKPNFFDADGNGAVNASYEATMAPTRDATNSAGLFINNGLYVAQKLGLTLGTGGKLFVGGAFKTDGNNTDQQINLANIDTATSLISTTTTLSPPALDSRFSRYRRLTAETLPAGGGAYGFGEGVYIDNGDDLEKIGTRVLENWELQRLWQRKPFDTTDASKMFFPPSATPTAWAYPQTSGTLSLEQRGARGWINPWQFLPRGSFIELKGDDIIITRDDRSDAPPTGDIPQKFWNAPDGTPEYGVYRMRINASSGARYLGLEGAETLVATEPFNGVVFADGNVRVRGYLGNSNLTIASLGTIYVEGNILRNLVNTANPPRIALIAKRNVVVNPTLFVGLPVNWRDSDINGVLNAIPLAESIATTSQVLGSTTDDTIRLANLIRVGDLVRVGGQVVTVTAVSPTAGLTVSPSVNAPVFPATGSAIPAGSVANVLDVDPPIKYGKSTEFTSLNEAITSGAYNYDTTEKFFQLPANGGGLVREARFDSPDTYYSSNPLWLNYLHGAQMRRAFTLQRQAIPTKNATVKANVAPPAIADTEKVLDLDGEGTFDLRDVDGSPGPDGDATENITALVYGAGHFPILDASPSPLWKIIEDTSTGQPAVGTVAARRLAKASASMSSFTLLGKKAYLPIALTTSRELVWNNGSTATSAWFGGAPASNPTAVETDAVGEGVSEEFYWRTPLAGGHNQSLLRTTSRQLTDGSTAPANGWRNRIALRMDAAPLLPGYRIASPRISPSDFSSAGAFNPIGISIQATIVVRDGSFFVLPAPAMANSTVNLNGDTNTLTEDNLVDGKDIAAATCYRRLNYHIEIRGNISQNLAPTGLDDYDTTTDPDGKAVGATVRWLDAASYPANTGSNPLQSNATFGGAVGAVSWNTVSYVADSVPADTLPLPASPDLLYVG